MMVRVMGFNSRPDTLVQDRTPQPHRFLLQRTAGPYIGVKRFQTIYHYSVMLLAGSCFSSVSAPRPFHHGIRRRGGTICAAALPSDRRQVQADMRTHLIHRPARTFSTTRWSSIFLLLDLILHGFHAAAVAFSRVHRNSVPSTRCGAGSRLADEPGLRSPFHAAAPCDLQISST